MVRLKVRPTSKGLYPARFQFQMVRLKVDEIIDSAEGLPMFQFQMVRLKVQMFVDNMNRRDTFQFQMVRLKVVHHAIMNILEPIVSIPNGTIKRRDGYGCRADHLPFQFQMVRLKDDPRSALFFEFLVSIPNGTIKSRTVPAASCPPRRFNSKWYD